MQTGQVSIWIPIIVGIIGLISVISGQLVNAWREDRRLRRDQEREEIRWNRELKKEFKKQKLEDSSHWRDKRFHLYTELLSFTREAFRITSVRLMELKTGEIRSGDSSHLPVRDRLYDSLSKLEEMQRDVTLLSATTSARNRINEILDGLSEYITRVVDIQRGVANVSAHHIGGVNQIIENLVLIIREDLRISHDDEEEIYGAALHAGE
ncbi:hypothetical protein [Amycolatopsis sp. CA-230715]|uniref:hypothetical protein n=1 Tax=Amycolatopsis sp. CA-230715 TaxID=2745196 RepID=UPI001C0333AB|nr:hypothetical protein [Amycolatopsis sp. CA-230715]